MLLSNQPQLRGDELVTKLKPREIEYYRKIRDRRMEIDLRPLLTFRSLAFNDYYWGHLVAQPVAYCNQRRWQGRPLWIVNGNAVEVFKDDIHNFHLGFLGQQEEVYGTLGGIAVRNWRTTKRIVHDSKHRKLELHEVTTEFFMETIIAAWSKISEGELELSPPQGVDVNTLQEMADMYT